MAFDCFIIDFKNSKSKTNIDKISAVFPYARVIPFVGSYLQIARSVLKESRTQHTWMLSSKIDYSDFDFDYIPEQHQAAQLHVWNNQGQNEGDTFLFPHNFMEQDVKYLRDYEDVNYHSYDVDYDFDFLDIQYNLCDVIDSLPKHSVANCAYIKYSEVSDAKTVYPSYWEDLKVYIDGTTFYIPGKALDSIKTQVYDYPLLYTLSDKKENDCFDIAFISNGEPFEQHNFDRLQKHIKEKNLKNKLHWIRNVDGRTKAYKKAAETVSTEYFYAVFAKSMVRDDFMFDYTVDRGLSRKHRIFHARLNELDLEYGTFNINLYSRSLCIETPDDNILDFTLSQPHQVVGIVASESLLAPDPYTAWKNARSEKYRNWSYGRPNDLLLRHVIG